MTATQLLASIAALVGAASPAGAGPVADVAVGRDGACAVRDNGGVWCWGNSRAFGDADDEALRPHRIGTLVAKSVAVGGDHACAIDGGGAVWCAGQDDVTAPARGREQNLPDDSPDPGAIVWRRIPGVPPAKQIVSGDFHVCTLGASGDVTCWGADNDNITGPGSTGKPRLVPGLAGTTALAAASDLTCALGSDRKIRCFGRNELGNTGSHKQVATLPIANATALAVGPYFACGLDAGGTTASCVGGTEAFTGSDTPDVHSVKLPERAARMVSGARDLCVIGASGKLWCSGMMQSLLQRTGALKPGAWAAYPSSVRAAAMHWTDVCAITTAGELACAGGRNMPGPHDDTATPVAVVGLANAVELVAAANHACARLADHGVACWGGSFEDAAIPHRVAALDGATALNAGGATTCAVTAAGKLACWEPLHVENSRANLVVPAIAEVAAVAVGSAHACAIQRGAVSCWGAAYHQALGYASKEQYPKPATKPVTVAGLAEIRRLDAGNSFTCALAAAGTVKCWGHNEAGELGQGIVAPDAPVGDVISLPRVDSISVGSSIACALGADKRAYCWGERAYAPIPWPGAADVTAISAGNRACIVRASGIVECGLPGISRRVSGITNARSVAAGDGFACALLADGTVRCWGKRDDGQLGDGHPPITTTLDVVRLGD